MTVVSIPKRRKALPPPSADLLFRPESDPEYVHFEDASLHPFDDTAAGFSRVNAWWLADAALLAYWDGDAGRRIWRTAGLDSSFHSVPGTQCHIAWTPQFAIVTFRGTEPDDFQDILDIARFGTRPWERGGKVHEGFLDAFERIWKEIRTPLHDVADSRPVWFTGHSLGGALATLAIDRFGRGQIYTVGSPRVGNRAFASGFDGRHEGRSFRYVNNTDLVCELPPAGFLLQYLHINQRKFIDDSGGISDRAAPMFAWRRASGEMRQAQEALALMANQPALPPPPFLVDHTPRRYAVHTWNDFAAT